MWLCAFILSCEQRRERWARVLRLPCWYPQLVPWWPNRRDGIPKVCSSRELRVSFFTYGKWEPAWKNTKALGLRGSVTRSYLKLLARCAYLATPPAVHSRDRLPLPLCYQAPVFSPLLTWFPCGRLGPLHLRLANSCRPPMRGGSRSPDCVFSALGAHVVHTSSVNNCLFSHRLFRISDETAEMSVWHVSHQSERGSATPLYSSPTAVIFKGEKPSLSLVSPFLRSGMPLITTLFYTKRIH